MPQKQQPHSAQARPGARQGPFRIQLAIQGGGAKLCALLAAMEALKKFETDQKLVVTRLSGTSAGSIAAALYASGADFNVIRQQIRGRRDELSALFPKPGLWDLIKVLLKGRPMVDINKVQRVLAAVFAPGITEFQHLQKPLVVVTTDVTNGKAYHFERGDDVIIGALMSSCAIPYYFRGPGRAEDGMLLVDGGVCENLPSAYLSRDTEKDGIPIGITFKAMDGGRTPTNLLSFSMRLLESAMNNSVRRAQESLGVNQLLPLETDIGTFEFDRAVREGMEDKYELAKIQATDFFERLCQRLGELPQEEVVVEAEPEPSATHLQRVADLYKAQHEFIRIPYAEARIVVRLGALSRDASGTGRPDYMSYTLKFAAGKEPLACQLVRVLEQAGAQFRSTVRWKVFDKNGNSIRTIDLLGKDQQHPDRRMYLLFFDPMIDPKSQADPYTLQYSHEVQDLMAPLVSEGKDEIGVSTIRASEKTPRAILVAMVPKTHPNIGIRESSKTTGSVRGRRMTENEINLLELPEEPGYYPLGWIGEEVEPGMAFQAELYDPNFSISKELRA